MNYCEKCKKTVDTKVIHKKEEFLIYGESIEVDSDVLVCSECGEELFDETLDNETMLKAYAEYRNKHKYLSPEEIKAIREQYGLSQRGFAKLLNWGDKTIFRYENGSLQDKAHDSILKMLKDPENMKKYLEENELKISQKEKEKLLSRINGNKTVSVSFTDLFDATPSLENGYKVFDYEKYCAMIRYFVDNNITMLKVKLLKLMNYADMLFYSENGVSISGSKYIHLQYGPVPERFDLLFDLMMNDGYLVIEEIINGDYLKYQVYSGKNNIGNVLSDKELETLKRVDSFFKDYGSKEIAEFSHLEERYINSGMYETIPYSYAGKMNFFNDKCES